jgi:uncharacterized secreted repeat protein (TIGR03808 family)
MGTMIDRRHLLLGTLAGTATLAVPALAAPLSRYGLDAAEFGVQPGAPDDQSAKLQHAIGEAARRRAPLVLAPGHYRAGDLKLASGVQIMGVRGATYLELSQGPSLIAVEHADTVTLSGLILDGTGKALPKGRGLIHLVASKDLRVGDCELRGAGGNALSLVQCAGVVERNAFRDAADNALFCLDSQDLNVTGNTIRGSGNGGIRVWQSEKRHDGTLVADNIIEDTSARAGGNGENGNAVNVFRAANVIVRNNRIARAAFTAIRGNAASDIQVIGNHCRDLDEVALYAEFDFEGAVIAYNVVDGAAVGVSVTNFNIGGRLAVVQGNLIRNLKPKRPQGGPDAAGLGIGVEADTAVTGNVIENAPHMGISVGYGKYLRDVTVSGNVVRETGIGIGVSVTEGAGRASITGNIIEGAQRGAIIGMAWDKPATGDLTQGGAAQFPQLTVANNQVR